MAATKMPRAPESAGTPHCNPASLLCTLLTLALLAGCSSSPTAPNDRGSATLSFQFGGGYQSKRLPGWDLHHEFEHSLDEGCPLEDYGLAFSAQDKTIGGTPTKATDRDGFACGYRAVRQLATGPHTRYWTLRIVIHSALPTDVTLGALRALPPLTVGTGMTPHALPRASGGVPLYTYDLDCGSVTLDDIGVSLTPSTPVGANVTPELSGTPTRAGNFSCVFRVTDSATPSPGTDEVNLPLTVNGSPPGVDPLTIASAPSVSGLTAGTKMTPTAMPVATGGKFPYTYALACTGGQNGLSIDPTTPTQAHLAPYLSGTPTTAGARVCTYTVTDSSSPTVTYPVQFLLEVAAAAPTPGVDPLTIASAPSVSGLTAGTKMTPTAMPVATGGKFPYTYALACTGGQNGLSIDPTTPTQAHLAPYLSGTPTTAGARVCTYTVTDSSSPTVTYPVQFLLEIGGGDGGLDSPLAFTPGDGATVQKGVGGSYRVRRGAGLDGFAKNVSVTVATSCTGVTFGFSGGSTRTVSGGFSLDQPNSADQEVIVAVEVPSVLTESSCTVKHNYSVATTTPINGVEPYILSIVSASSSTQNPVHQALLPDHGRRTATGAGRSIGRAVSAWAADPLGRETATLAPELSVEALGGTIDGFSMSGTSRAVDLTAAVPARTDWLLGVNARSVETDSTYQALTGALTDAGYSRGNYDTSIVSVAPFVASRIPSGAYAYAGAGAGRGTLRHRDIESEHTSWNDWSTAALDLRTWHVGGGLPLGNAAGGTLDFATRVDGFALNARKSRVMARDFRFTGTTWTAGGSWTHQSRWRPSLHVDWEHDSGDGTDGSRLVVGAAIDAAGIGHPRLALELDARHVRDVDADADDGWRVRGGLRWSGAPSGHGMSADLGTTVRTEDDGTVATLGGELRWRGVPSASLGAVEPYGGFEQLVSGSTRHRLGLRLPGGDGRTIAAEAWQKPDVDDFGIRLIFRSDL